MGRGIVKYSEYPKYSNEVNRDEDEYSNSHEKTSKEAHLSWLIAFLGRLQSCFADRKPNGN